MGKLDMIWAMFKVYFNNPNVIIKQSDKLADLCGNGGRDVQHICHSLGIPVNRKITFGQLLKKCNIL